MSDEKQISDEENLEGLYKFLVSSNDDRDLGGAVFQIADSNLILIGKIIVRFSYLESIVEMLIATLAGIPVEPVDEIRPHEILMSAMDFDKKVGVLQDLVGIHPALKDNRKARERFCAAVNALQRAQGERNKVAHTKWFSIKGAPQLTISWFQKRSKGRLKPELVSMTTQDFERILSNIEDAIDKAAHFISGPPHSRTQ